MPRSGKRGGKRGEYPRQKTKPKIEFENPTWLRVKIEQELSDRLSEYCKTNKITKTELVNKAVKNFFEVSNFQLP